MNRFELLNAHNPRAGYEFTMAGVAISGRDLNIDFRDGRCHVTQTEDGYTWAGMHNSLHGAILALVASRLGVDTTEVPMSAAPVRWVAP